MVSPPFAVLRTCNPPHQAQFYVAAPKSFRETEFHNEQVAHDHCAEMTRLYGQAAVDAGEASW